MIKTDEVTLNGFTYTYTRSDAGYKILQVETGVFYGEAYDGVPCPYTYTETDEPIDDEEPIEPQEELNRVLNLLETSLIDGVESIV